MPKTHKPRSIEITGASHKAPIPAAARVGNLLCTSAVSGKDPFTGELPTNAAAQAHNAFINLKAVLEAGGGSLLNIAKLSVTLKDNSLREIFNNEWNTAFPNPLDRPARHIVLHNLEHNMLLQIEAIAFVA